MAARGLYSLAHPTAGRLIAKLQGLSVRSYPAVNCHQSRNGLLYSGSAAAGIQKMRDNKRAMLQKCSFFGRKITKTRKFLRLYSFFDPFKPNKRKLPKITVFLQDFAP
jgi:hypothetical protein